MSARPHEEMTTEGLCPRCGQYAHRDEVDIGVGIQTGPWGCECGWSEDTKYDALYEGGFQPDGGYRDPQGGYWPKDNPVVKAMRAREDQA